MPTQATVMVPVLPAAVVKRGPPMALASGVPEARIRRARRSYPLVPEQRTVVFQG